MDRGQRPEGARVVVLPKVEIRHGVTGSLLRRKLNSRHRATTRSFRDGVRIYNMQCCSERDVLGCDNKFWQVWAHRYRFRQIRIQIQRGIVDVDGYSIRVHLHLERCVISAWREYRLCIAFPKLLIH